MPWTFDDSKAVTNVIPSAAGRNYYEWRREIRDHNTHPRQAAQMCGNMKYERLSNCYSIRLSGSDRCYFEVDEDGQAVNILEVGGHDRS